jgi:hypothetical protein
MRNKHTNRRKLLLPKTPPQTLIKPTNPIIRISRTLPIRNPIEEMSIVRSFLPHPLHFRTAWLEVAEVLFPDARFFIDFYGVAVERRGRGFGGFGEGFEDAFSCFAGTAVGGGVELEGVVWF